MYNIRISQVDIEWLVRKTLNQTVVRVIWIVFWVDITKANIIEFFANGHFRTNQFNNPWLLGHRLRTTKKVIIGQGLKNYFEHRRLGDLNLFSEFNLFSSFAAGMYNGNFILKYSCLTVRWNWNEINSWIPYFLNWYTQLGCIEIWIRPTLTQFQTLKI